MEAEEIIESFREMNHMIELEYDELPGVENDEWAPNWIRFHDTLSGGLICINEYNHEDPNEPVGTLIISAGIDLTIPKETIKKYIEIEEQKSYQLQETNIELITIKNPSHMVKEFNELNQMLHIVHTDYPKGWVAFHDTNTKKLIIINERDQDSRESLGSIIVLCAESMNIEIPHHQKEKYINAQKMKSQLALVSDVNVLKQTDLKYNYKL